MNSLQIKTTWVILLASFMLIGCGKDSVEFYLEKSANDWETYLSEINNGESISLNNTVLLVLRSSECSPALTELKQWDDFQNTSKSANINLVILERYNSTFQNFLDFEDITLSAYRDSAGIIFNHRLLPTTPMKVFINVDGEVEKIRTIGNGEGQEEFISS